MRIIAYALVLAAALGLFGCSAPYSDIYEPKDPGSQIQSQSTDLSGPKASSDVAGLTPIYDAQDILSAYRSGDPSELSQKDKAIYDAALSAISDFYREGMTDEETVLAAHDWLVLNVTYDKKMMLPVPKQSQDSENPYGALINGQAICMGYTTSFQLFMDMLGIESRILRGSSEGEEHAWNIVKLGDNWYHVDVTWDDFVPDEDGRPAFHMYCLVTDSAMEILHVWDRDSAPKADDNSRVYYLTHGLYADSAESGKELIEAAARSGSKYAEIMTDIGEDIYSKSVESYWVIEFSGYSVIAYWLK